MDLVASQAFVHERKVLLKLQLPQPWLQVSLVTLDFHSFSLKEGVLVEIFICQTNSFLLYCPLLL